MNILKYDDKRFKSVYISYNITRKLSKEEIAPSVISCFSLIRGSKKYKTSKEIEKYLASLYGANFDINIEKIGDLFNFEFKIQCVNKNYLPNEEDVLIRCLEFLNEVIYNPNIEDGLFDESVFEREKKTVISEIEKRKDEKIKYAIGRAEELMAVGTAAGCYVYGDLNDAKNTTNSLAVEKYNTLIRNSLKTIILSGNLKGYENIDNEISKVLNRDIYEKSNREDLLNSINNANIFEEGIKETFENMDTNQASICFGLKNFKEKDEDYFVANMYNAILGTTPSSKLFQNVREKASLAYTARSRYYRFKKFFVIFAGIEKKNYKKAKEIIIEQIEDMKKGNITKEEFDTAKASIIADMKEYTDSKVLMSKFLYTNYITRNDFNIEDVIKEFEKVTLEDVVSYAQNVEIKLIYFLGGEAHE